ncbi:hypothetical protein CLV51_11027 [Chitinophaga niastensis]|uniref:Uncharacterized protein n=1 Tax=Chitinophaga niastensis TaxID=536980 RepID=A0A2P8H9E5_CHINA|nr:hypothetical protein [Chitinophaga niastensis]PSL42811.1 hypothetical protein CLV51_11027 [Chitinophaga niastensis]
MKALNNLSLIQRARLLHQLFQEQIPLFLQHLKNICGLGATLDADIESDSYYSIMELKDMMIRVNEIFATHDYHLEKSRKIFSENLFQDKIASLVTDCLLVYVADDMSTCKKFDFMVAILFINDDNFDEDPLSIGIKEGGEHGAE